MKSTITADIVEHNSSKMVDSKAHVDGRLWPEIVWVVGMMLVLLCQQCCVGSLGKLAFLVDECQDVKRLDCNQFQSFLVVDELNVLPVDHLVVVLFLHTTGSEVSRLLVLMWHALPSNFRQNKSYLQTFQAITERTYAFVGLRSSLTYLLEAITEKMYV